MYPSHNVRECLSNNKWNCLGMGITWKYGNNSGVYCMIWKNNKGMRLSCVMFGCVEKWEDEKKGRENMRESDGRMR